ncbi:MAG: hypothetical protein WBP83_02910 [Nitrososphaeraceae archaeon]
MNGPRTKVASILTFAFTSFVMIWIGNCIIYKNGEVAPDILGVNQSPSSSSPSTTLSMMERGDIAMGFNQNKIAHDFTSIPTGGEIMITALDPNDTETTEQIKNHVLDIQKDFTKGNFSKPFFIHAEEVPGTKVMTEKKDLIKYSIQNLGNDAILILDTRDDEVINAIHHFMNYQVSQHHGH